MNDDTDLEGEPREEIARLEARIEELAEGIERCRKINLFSKILIAGGMLWAIAAVFSLLGPTSMTTIVAITAILGGLVLNGSNRSSSQQLRSAMDAAEARRAELIGDLDLRTIQIGTAGAPDTSRWLH